MSVVYYTNSFKELSNKFNECCLRNHFIINSILSSHKQNISNAISHFFIKMCINPVTRLSVMMFHILGNENCIDFNSSRGNEIIDVSKKINGYNDIGAR